MAREELSYRELQAKAKKLGIKANQSSDDLLAAIAKKRKEPKFTKGQLVGSERYKFKKDQLNVLLDDDKTYSIKEVDKLLKKFKEREV